MSQSQAASWRAGARHQPGVVGCLREEDFTRFHQQKDFLAAVNSVETAGLTESTHEGRNHEGY